MAEVEHPKRSTLWPWLISIPLLAVGGWHYICTLRLEASIQDYIASHFGEGLGDANIEIHVQPITNLVAIEVKVVDRGAAAMKPSDRVMLDAMLSSVRSTAEPYFERELSLAAREQADPYAMVLPYRVAFSLDISPKK